MARKELRYLDFHDCFHDVYKILIQLICNEQFKSLLKCIILN